MANEEHVRRLRNESVEEWNAWRKVEPDVIPDFSGADFSDADLTSAQINYHTSLVMCLHRADDSAD